MILLLIKDMIFSAKVTEVLGSLPYTQARSLEDFQNTLTAKPELAVINLNIPGDLAFEALAAAQAQGVRTLCFFSHVNEDLKARAQSLGATEISPRSKLTMRLGSILGTRRESH